MKLRNIFGAYNEKGYKVVRIFGFKLRFKSRKIDELEREVKLLRTLIEKSIDITQIPKAKGNYRKIQIIKTKMLKIIDIILKKHNIPYWVEYGSLIGTIRHKGFIPWDDDVDLGCFKSDYLNLPAIFDKELSGTGFYSSVGRGRKTQLLRLEYKQMRFCIDFFPFEYINQRKNTKEEKEEFVSEWLKIRHDLAQKYPIKLFVSGENDLFDIVDYADNLKAKYFQGYYDSDNTKTGQIIRSVETMTTTVKCAVFDTEYIFPLVDMPFEDLLLPCPKDPLMHLCQANEYGPYGAVMNFPTINDSGFKHMNTKYKDDVDYDEIINELTQIANNLSAEEI